VGTCVTVTMAGRRPLVSEVQALVSGDGLTAPRRATSGLDAARVAMVLAVLEKRGGLRLAQSEVYAATVGGGRVTDPSADLALAMAIASAAHELPVSTRSRCRTCGPR
jgi:DNA repair protein RadA/Sms